MRSSNGSGSSSSVLPQCRVAKVVRDLQSGAMFDSSTLQSSAVLNHNSNNNNNNCSSNNNKNNHHRWSRSSPLPPPPPPAPRNRDSEKIVHRAVLGYLGTIDIPNHLKSVSMMSLVKKCIKRIKTEKQDPTLVSKYVVL